MSAPEKSFRLGHVTSGVFLKTADKHSFRVVTPQRSHREGEETKYSNTFSVSALPTLMAIVVISFVYVVIKEVW